MEPSPPFISENGTVQVEGVDRLLTDSERLRLTVTLESLGLSLDSVKDWNTDQREFAEHIVNQLFGGTENEEEYNGPASDTPRRKFSEETRRLRYLPPDTE